MFFALIQIIKAKIHYFLAFLLNVAATAEVSHAAFNTSEPKWLNIIRILKMSVIERTSVDRRSVVDRRVAYNLDYFQIGGLERRKGKERRLQLERRDGWIRILMWTSVNIKGLKMAELSE